MKDPNFVSSRKDLQVQAKVLRNVHLFTLYSIDLLLVKMTSGSGRSANLTDESNYCFLHSQLVYQ